MIVLELIFVVAFTGFVVLPALGVGEGSEPSCARTSAWTDSVVDSPESSSPETKSNVILVMLDGVRWQEMVDAQRQGTPTFSSFRSTLSSGGHFF